MSSKAPIPIMIGGRSTQMAMAVAGGIAPDYDVVHVSTTESTAITEISAYLLGSFPTPASQTGSNVSRPSSSRLKPLAVVFGGGFTNEQFEEVKQGVREKTGGREGEIAWLKIKPHPGGPDMGYIVGATRGMLRDVGLGVD